MQTESTPGIGSSIGSSRAVVVKVVVMVVEAASLVVVDQCRPDTRHKHRTCRSQGYSRSSRPEGRELRSTQMEGTPGIGSGIGSSRGVVMAVLEEEAATRQLQS